ncbi:CinA family protein [Novosphingobium profundi]|uniref:CinA family protein n=1 Tax=Novosphingobium profundi TaxID=1774954 RepID=UPI001FE79590|nr:nicotinamide-nucleotide amidohydrolase family protein [Novosphingobium profundi]
MALLLTALEGASDAFERGFIAYSKLPKCDLLGVSHSMIGNYGAVNEAVARAMALGALARSNASLAIAITGFAGPAGPGDEAGLVHFACALHGIASRHGVEHFGDIGRSPDRLPARGDARRYAGRRQAAAACR